MGLLDGQIRQAIAAGFRGRLLKGTLRTFAVPASTTLDPDGDPYDEPVPTDFPCEGLVAPYDAAYRARAMIPETDVKITLIAGLTRGIPARDSKVRIEGRWHQVRAVSKDPAQATWVLQAYVVADGDWSPAP